MSMASRLSAGLLLVLFLGLCATPAWAQKKKPAGTYTTLPVKATSIGALIAQLPGTKSYLLVERPRFRSHVKVANVIDLEAGTVTGIQPPNDHFCAGVSFSEDGNPVIAGGHQPGNHPVQDGRKVVSLFNRFTHKFTKAATMTYARWYPTVLRVEKDQFLVSGGTSKPDGGDIAVYAELFDKDAYEQGKAPLKLLPQPTHFADSAKWNWYPFLGLLPGGHVLWWGDLGGSITDGAAGKLLVDLPPVPETVTYHIEYPWTGSPVMVPLRWDNDYETRFCIFGGSDQGATAPTPASSNVLCLSIKACDSPGGYCFGNGWEMEDMGIKRVMADTVALPNGKIAILHGARNGRAGYGKGFGPQSSDPNTISLLYDPYAPAGKRFKSMAPTPIIRMYHTTACLHTTGEILVTGGDTVAKYKWLNAVMPAYISPSPDYLLEYRIQMIKPTEIANGVARPVIVTAPKIIFRGQSFTVDFEYGAAIIGASLVAPCGTTHSIGMNQRVVMLKVTSAVDGRAVIEAPPAALPHLALKGHYLLFLLGKSRTYSEGVWLELL